MDTTGFGVSNAELDKFLMNNGRNLSDNFVGVFPTNKKKFLDEINRKETNYPFIIANTDPARKLGIQWWSFLNTDERDTLFFFDSFGTLGLLNFIVTNDLDVFKKLIPGHIKQIFKQDNKITLLKWNFKLNNYENLTQKELNRLSTTARHFFRFLYDFSRYKKIRNTVKAVRVDNNLQSFKTDYWGPLQMYFHLNLFEPVKGSVVAEPSSKKLDVNLIDILLNEMFNTRTRQNERILDAFILQHDIEFDGEEASLTDEEMEPEPKD